VFRPIIIFATSLALMACAGQRAEPGFDLILAGGLVYSGEDSAGFEADVGIRQDRITAIGDLEAANSELRLDVTGLVVSPGFVDIHSHAVRSSRENSGLFRHPEAENYVRQGVTTAIGGPDGGSWFPIRNLLDGLESEPLSINFGTFVGHNTIRQNVMQREDRPATDTELQQMKDMVRQGMRDGAYGLSTGLKYIPGAYADTGEVIELARVAGQFGGIHISHMREEGLELLKSVRETIRIGEEGGLPTQLTHHKVVGAPMWGKSTETLDLVDAALQRGVDVSIDQYPYTASSTGISILFPAWSQEGNDEAQRARLDDPETRARIKQAVIDNLVRDRGGNDPARVALADCSWDTSLNGKNLAQVLLERGLEPSIENAADLAMELLYKGGCMSVFHAMSELDVVRIMQHPATMVASDGGIHVAGEGVPHPRNYGTFARILNKYVRDDRTLPLHTAIHKMARIPADRIKLADRGRIETGAIADIAVFDPVKVRDTASFENPHQYARGMIHVFVAGQAVLLNGEMTTERPGRILRADGQPKGN